MIILIDSGNSRIKLGLLDSVAQTPFLNAHDPKYHFPQLRTAAFENKDLLGLEVWLREYCHDVRSAWGVNVAGAVQMNRLDDIFSRRHCAIRWCLAQAQTGRLLNAYENPQQLGPDRWAAMVGVMARTRVEHPPLLIASFGTATTIDVVGSDNIFHGGMILPGPEIMTRALSVHTAELPLARAPTTLWPKETMSAISTGVAAAQAGALMRQVFVATEKFETVPTIYVTGGGWPIVEAEARRMIQDTTNCSSSQMPDIHVLANPVLDGLAFMAQHVGT